MATIVSSIGTSHSPMLLNTPEIWLERSDQDRNNEELHDSGGKRRTYDELLAAAGDRYEKELDQQLWTERHRRCQQSMDRLADDISSLDLDAVVVIGDDQSEVFDRSIQPAIGIYWGETWHTGELEGAPPGDFFDNVKTGYAMDDMHHFAGAPNLALDLIRGLIEHGFDVTSLAEMPEGRGFGHAYGFVIRRLLGDRRLPVVPVLLNTYYPPNQPTAARCYDLGVALADATRRATTDHRVLFAASGGLSHFVINEGLDRRVLDGIRNRDPDSLRTIPDALLQSGSSEIRNWIAVAGAMSDRNVAWSEYVPCYRTAAGTGCGMAFARWE